MSEVIAADIAWMLTATCLVFFMTPGLSFFYGGMVSKKNIISTMLQSFVALGVVSIWWVLIGFSLCFGESNGGIIGNPLTYFAFDNVGIIIAQHTIRIIRHVPIEIRRYNARTNHRKFC